ncbi:MAG: CBS domain-containing protein [Pseudomonadota bacterium]
MTAQSIMDPDPTVLRPSDTIDTAMCYIMKHRYRNLPVVDDDFHFLGVVGINCILRLALPKAVIMEFGLNNAAFIRETLEDLHRRFNAVREQTIDLCTYGEVSVVRPDTPLVETLMILYRTQSSLPVVHPDSHRLVGVISYWDACSRILSTEV